MGLQVSAGAVLRCSGGVTPSPLAVLPVGRPLCGGPAANVGDSAPFVNIVSFGMCSMPSNPAVAAATSAALGVLTPMPCVPAPAGTWVPANPKVLVGGLPALTSDGTLVCAWGGVISVSSPGQSAVVVA